MASRCRSFSRPTLNLLKSTISKPSAKTVPSAILTRSSPTFGRQNFFRPSKSYSIFFYLVGYKLSYLIFRSRSQLGSLQSLLPLHSAVSSARLTSCLGVDPRGSRSLSQGMLCKANPGVWSPYVLITICKQLVLWLVDIWDLSSLSFPYAIRLQDYRLLEFEILLWCSSLSFLQRCIISYILSSCLYLQNNWM